MDGLKLAQSLGISKLWIDLDSALKVQSRLSSWKEKQLTMAGPSLMLQSVSSAIPRYAMQSTRLPQGLIRLIKLRVISYRQRIPKIKCNKRVQKSQISSKSADISSTKDDISKLLSPRFSSQ